SGSGLRLSLGAEDREPLLQGEGLYRANGWKDIFKPNTVYRIFITGFSDLAEFLGEGEPGTVHAAIANHGRQTWFKGRSPRHQVSSHTPTSQSNAHRIDLRASQQVVN